MTGPFLRNPYLLFMTIAVVFVAGLSALLSLPQLEDPRIVGRFPLVLAAFPGASAERVEALVAEPLENALDEIAEIKTIQSNSRAGFTTLSIELADSVTEATNDDVFARVRTKIEEAALSLPPGAAEPRVDDQLLPVAFTRIAALIWNGSGEAPMGVLSRRAEDLADALRAVPGTELVRVFGETSEEIRVEVDGDELQLLGLSTAQLAQRAAAADSRTPAGALRSGHSTLLIEVDGALDSLDRIRSIPLRSERGMTLRLGDIAQVSRAVEDPLTAIGIVDGHRAVLVGARMGADVRVGPWAKAVTEAMEKSSAFLGDTIETRTVFDQSIYTRARLGELMQSLGLGALVVMLVVLVTMGWRRSLLVGLALPLTASATLFFILLLGGQIHQMSIFGMIIAMGLLIDNAIVVVDEIRKRRVAGMSTREAVEQTSQHLRGPLFASTLTTVLAFAPIVLLPGAAGDFVGYIGVSVILAITSSYFLSLTVIAALAGRYGGGGPESVTDDGGQAHSGFTTIFRDGIDGGRAASRFRAAMTAGLKRPILTMAVAALIPIIGFIAGSQLQRAFFPPTDRNMFDIQVWLPVDASIERTERAVGAIEDRIRQYPKVEQVHWLVGESFPSVYYNLITNTVNTPRYARGVIVVDSADSTERLVPILQREIDAAFPDVQAVVRGFGQGPPVEADVQYRVFGPDIKTLQELGEQVRLAMQSHRGILHTQVSLPRGEPKLWLEADELEAERAGLTLTEVASQLQAGLEGIAGGVMLEDLEQLPVRFRLKGAGSKLSQLESLRLATRSGSAPLEALGKLTLRPELGGISRVGGERCNTVLGYTAKGFLPIATTQEVLADLNAGGFELPTGYRLEVGGSAEADQEAVGNLLAFAPILLTIMMAAIILVFRSLRIGGILIFVGVLSVGMALLSTWVMGFPISFNTILGTLGLIGVALNDSIVVLAAIRDNPKARRGNHGAILDEVLGCTRHVVSTTLTTMGGFLPLLLFVGGQFWPSLAIVLVGGVGGATILALIFVPAAYVLVHRKREDEVEELEHKEPVTRQERLEALEVGS